MALRDYTDKELVEELRSRGWGIEELFLIKQRLRGLLQSDFVRLMIDTEGVDHTEYLWNMLTARFNRGFKTLKQ